MIKVLFKGKDISENCGRLNLSNTKSDICMKLTLDILKDIEINLADEIEIREDDKLLFYGFLFHIDVDDNNVYNSLTFYDPLIYFKKSKIKKGIFENTSSNSIINSIIAESGGISLGQNDLQNENITVNLKGKTLYDSLIEVIKKVTNINKKDYILKVLDKKISIVELGYTNTITVKWNDGVEAGTLLSKKYSENLENMINTVYILDDKDNVIDTKTSNLTKFGTIATTFKPDKENKETPESQFKGIETKIDISIIGDFSFFVGCKVPIELKKENFEMYVESVTHNYSDGILLTDLSLTKEWEGDDK